MYDNITLKQAIRKKCLECSNGQYKEIKDCIIESCPLYEFRIGERHLKKNNGTSEQISLDFILIEN